MKQTNNRIAALRKNLGITQIEFAEKLGLTSAAISAIELGKAPLTEVNIRLICFTFGVNRDWLVDGTGDMFSKDITLTDQERRIIENYRQLSPKAKEQFAELIRKELERQQLRKAEIQRVIAEFELNTEETAIFLQKVGGDDDSILGFRAIAKIAKTDYQKGKAGSPPEIPDNSIYGQNRA